MDDNKPACEFRIYLFYNLFRIHFLHTANFYNDLTLNAGPRDTVQRFTRDGHL